MPSPREIKPKSKDLFDEILRTLIKQHGFVPTLKSLEKGRVPTSEMMSIVGGVLEEQASGCYSAALDTDKGRVVLQNAQRTDRLTDAQSIPTSVHADDESPDDIIGPDGLIQALVSEGSSAEAKLLAEIELTRFNTQQSRTLLPLLWQYILENRDSTSPSKLVGVGAAIRKYVAILPMNELGQLALLLETGHRAALAIECEIEIAKMIYRNYEVYPPEANDPQPDLAQQLFEMVKVYTEPRVLVRDKFGAAASLCIQALAAMRSELAAQAYEKAITCPYGWFSEIVADSLDVLQRQWQGKNPEAAAWLAGLTGRTVD